MLVEPVSVKPGAGPSNSARASAFSREESRWVHRDSCSVSQDAGSLSHTPVPKEASRLRPLQQSLGKHMV